MYIRLYLVDVFGNQVDSIYYVLIKLISKRLTFSVRLSPVGSKLWLLRDILSSVDLPYYGIYEKIIL